MKILLECGVGPALRNDNPVHIGGLEGAVSGTLSSCKVDISQEPLIKPRPGYTGIISDM